MLDSAGPLTLVPPHPVRTLFGLPQTALLLLLGITGLLTCALTPVPTIRLATGADGVAVAWIFGRMLVRTARIRIEISPGLLTMIGPKKPLLVPFEQIRYVLVVKNLKRGFGVTGPAYYLLNEVGEAKFVWIARGWAAGQWEQLWQAIGCPPSGADDRPATVAQLVKRYPSLISPGEATSLIQKKRTVRVRTVLIVMVCAAIVFILRPR